MPPLVHGGACGSSRLTDRLAFRAMSEFLKTILKSQYEASLSMLNDCIEKCPTAHWDGRIANYPFWQVVYHALTYADYYLSRNEAAFVPRDFHPPQQGDGPFDDEPAREGGFSKLELSQYLFICLQKARDALVAETPESLERPAGFRGRLFSRGELHIYNIRHIQHHTGQLSAYLRRVGEAARWVGAGWH